MNASSVESLVDSLSVSVRANEAYEYLIDRIGDVFEKCSASRALSLLDELAVLEAINAIELCILASGGDRRIPGLCRHALHLAGIGESEIRITPDGQVIRRHIYFAKNGRGLIKIGSSMDTTNRIKSLETGAGEPLTLLASVPGSMGAERRLHQQFSKLHKHGEWFEETPELTEYIRALQKANDRSAT
ncbi:GIY-YIG nuclease family protein [Pseudomonas sp. Marseille-QA0332]